MITRHIYLTLMLCTILCITTATPSTRSGYQSGNYNTLFSRRTFISLNALYNYNSLFRRYGLRPKNFQRGDFQPFNYAHTSVQGATGYAIKGDADTLAEEVRGLYDPTGHGDPEFSFYYV